MPSNSKEELYDEEDALLTEEYENARAKALIAHSNLRSVSIAMILCVAIYLSILTARLELSQRLEWPLYIDFIPLFVLAVLVYVAATDFAATRVSSESAAGKVVVIVTGFLGSLFLLMLMVLICLRLNNVIDWRWTSVMFPLWVGMFISQFFICFLIPGFLRNQLLLLFFGCFLMMWALALVILLADLKLDGELPGVKWWTLLMPLWMVLLSQLALLEKRPLDVACRMLLLVSAILLPLRLDHTISLPWAVILVPAIVVMIMNIVQILGGSDSDK